MSATTSGAVENFFFENEKNQINSIKRKTKNNIIELDSHQMHHGGTTICVNIVCVCVCFGNLCAINVKHVKKSELKKFEAN